MENTSGGGFRLFSFGRRKKQVDKCGKCRIERAIIKMSNNDDETDTILLCVGCYNTYTAEQLLRGNPKKDEEEEDSEVFY